MRKEFSLIMRALLFVALAIVVWVVGVMIGQENTVTILNPYADSASVRSVGQPAVSIMMDYNGGQINTYHQLSLIGGNTLWRVLAGLSDQGKIKLAYNSDFTEAGLKWFSINGRADNVGGIRWHVWVNNVYQSTKFDNIELKSGDAVTLKYLYYNPL